MNQIDHHSPRKNNEAEDVGDDEQSWYTPHMWDIPMVWIRQRVPLGTQDMALAMFQNPAMERNNQNGDESQSLHLSVHFLLSFLAGLGDTQ